MLLYNSHYIYTIFNQQYVVIIHIGPPEITLSTTPDTTYTILPSSTTTNEASVLVLTQNVVLRANLEGKWKLPDESLINDSSIEITLFTKDLAGLYRFYVTSWGGSEELAIQIKLNEIRK